MLRQQGSQGRGRRWVVLAALVLAGCEADSWFTPAVVGRWEPTPIKLPILNRLDVIDELDPEPPNLTPVMPEDMEPRPAEYVLGPGDVVAIGVQDLQAPGQEMAVQRQVDDLGYVRHPVLGPIMVSGLTVAMAEEAVGRIALQKGYLKGEPQVTVLMLQGQQNTFSVIAQPGQYSTRPGTYLIRGSDFRLLDALAMSGGVLGFVENVYVYRQGRVSGAAAQDAEQRESPRQPADVLKEFLDRGPAPPVDPPAPTPGPPAPSMLDHSVEAPGPEGHWINIDGRWVQTPAGQAPAVPAPAGPAAAAPPVGTEAPELPSVVQRVIVVPYERLRTGDLRYNIVIRPGDIIRVPALVGGNIYIMGMVSRPGTYTLPGSTPLTLKQLVAASGGFAGLAIPERVDLIRRIGSDHEATLRLNMREIFEGNEPDVFLKPNDIVNVGTNLPSTPLAVVRSGFRFTYGFGFVLDRNFANDVFGNNNNNN